ncbi:hypothetical protein ACK3TF_004586 [Chlorella vulgaris]
MELAIAGVVGFIGWAAASTGKDSRVSGKEERALMHPQAYPFGPGTDAQKALDADRAATQARWEQAVQPGVTGVITPNTKPGGPLPYFTSEKTQATNNLMKQRRLEMFTGALDATSSETGTFRHKTETPARFKPEQNAMPVSFSGSSRVTAMGMDAATASRYVPSQLHQNIVPTQQVRVGRGVGVGTDVTATDGFHPMLRVMPKDFGWKKNNLPGGFVPGAAPICKRPSDVTVFSDNRPPRYWTQAQVALGPGRAVWTGPTTRSKDPGTGCGGSSKIVGSEYYGVMGGNDGSYTNSALPSRDRFDNNTGLPQANPTVARSGTGGYVNSAFDDSRLSQNRETQNGHGVGVLTGTTAHGAAQPYVLQPTNRTTTNAAAMGNPASKIGGGKARPMDRAARTLREQTHESGQPGIATPYIKGMRVSGTDKWLDRESKRYGQLVQGWMPAPNIASAFARRDGQCRTRKGVSLPSGTALPTSTTPIARPNPGQPTTTYNKLPSHNTRLDLNLVQSQLQSNDLAIRIAP